MQMRPESQRGLSVFLVTASIALSGGTCVPARAEPLPAGTQDSLQRQPAPISARLPAPADPGLPEAGDERVLAGHGFLFPALQETAFNTTHFGIRQGGGAYSIPRLPLSTIGTYDLRSAFLTENADLGIRLHDRFGLFGTFQGLALTGGDAMSALLYGGQFTAGGTIGGVVKLARFERTGTQLAGRVYGSIGTGRNLTVLPLVDAIVKTAQTNLGDVIDGGMFKYAIQETGSHEYGLSLHGAQALSRYFSFQGSMRYAHGGSLVKTNSPGGIVENTSTTDDLQFALAAAVDGMPAHVPIAAMVEYVAQQIWTRDDATGETDSGSLIHLVGAGIYYTGRRNLQLGIILATRLGTTPVTGVDANDQPASSGDPTFIYGQFVFRYSWSVATPQ
jgi:hypothetical protein